MRIGALLKLLTSRAAQEQQASGYVDGVESVLGCDNSAKQSECQSISSLAGGYFEKNALPELSEKRVG